MGKCEFKKNALREKLADGRTARGIFCCTREPALVEIFGYAGFDFCVIDTEHAPNDTVHVEQMVRAAEIGGLVPVVRVLKNDPGYILRALDVGAKGILVPQVNTAAEAQAAVKAAKYGPDGERGVAGIVRAARYGFAPMGDYIAHANSENLVLVQAETVEAVKNLDEILAVKGIDGVLIGPTDLSQSMGITGQFQNPEFRKTVHTIIEKTKKAGKWAAMFCLDAADARYWRSAGADIVALGTDTMLIAKAARDMLSAAAE